MRDLQADKDGGSDSLLNTRPLSLPDERESESPNMRLVTHGADLKRSQRVHLYSRAKKV